MWAGRKLKWALLFVLKLAVFGYFAMLLWNCIIPEVFHVPYLDYLQTVGLLVLAHLFFHGGGCGCRGGHDWRRRMWRKRWEKKLAAMTPEERERVKDEWRRKCAWGGEEEGKEEASK